MKKFLAKIILLLITFTSFVGINTNFVKADLINITTTTTNSNENVNIGNMESGTNRNDKLNNLGQNDDEFFQINYGGEKGIYYSLLRVAKDLKDLVFVLATIALLSIVIIVLFAENTEEQVTKFKKGIIWITIGIVVMQGAYAFATTLYDRSIGETLAFNFIENVVNPIIGVLEVLISVFFLGIAIFAFFRLVTANGEEDKVKTGKQAIVHAIIGFVIVKLAKVIVEGIYGTLNCTTSGFIIVSTSCLDTPSSSRFAGLIMQVLNWVNGFVGIIVLLMILYAGGLVLLSRGEEDNLKKAKSILIYVLIGVLVLIFNYLLLTFFIIPERTI